MPEARKMECMIREVLWISPTVMKIRFEPSRDFHYEPGQFLSVFVPNPANPKKPLRRAYSFANPWEIAVREGYELCVRKVDGGVGTTFLSELQPGDIFEATAPYGDFLYRQPPHGHSVCFIATGTGIAPFRAMILSEKFNEARPEKTTVLFGLSSEREIFYQGELEAAGVDVIHAVPGASPGWQGFRGRVTDYLKQLPNNWAWHGTEFFICGNPAMVVDTHKILTQAHGVREEAIHKELFINPLMELKAS